MHFEMATAARIVFGAGAVRDVGAIAARFGRRALLVTGRNQARAAQVIADLEQRGVTWISFPVAGEPTIELVQEGARLGRAERCEVVLGFGGGSVLDAAKAISALLTNDGELMDYLEVVGSGQPLTRAAAPCLAIPTTAGTGAEVTRNAVLGATPHRVKVSLRSAFILPRVALIDPELTYDLPPELTASTGLDALTQLIEPFVSCRANPLTDGFCREGLRRVANSLRRAFANGRDATARAEMSLASLLGGLALANAGLGAVHGFASPIGGRFPVSHGSVCAALLPHAMEVNCRALGERQPENPARARFTEIAQILTGHSAAGATDGIQWVRELCADLHVPSLGRLGVAQQDAAVLVENAAKASSMRGNPLPLTIEEMSEILRAAF